MLRAYLPKRRVFYESQLGANVNVLFENENKEVTLLVSVKIMLR